MEHRQSRATFLKVRDFHQRWPYLERAFELIHDVVDNPDDNPLK